MLTTSSTYISGTLRKDQKGFPKSVVKKKLKKGDCVWRRKGSTVVCKWKDKRDVLAIRNKHAVEMFNALNRKGE